jgi:CHAT domain-containing protein/tetratricopeptide (TPR) repeat protein
MNLFSIRLFSLVFLFVIVQTIGKAQQLNLKVYDSIMNLDLSDSRKEKKVEALLIKHTDVSAKELSNIYYEFSKWFWIRVNKDEKKAIFYAKKEYAIRSVNNTPDSDLKERNLYNLGYFYNNSTPPDYTNALNYLNEFLEIPEPNEKRLGKVYREMGNSYDGIGDFQKALNCYENSERLFKKIGDHQNLLFTYINISSTYGTLGDELYFDSFTENLQKIDSLNIDDIHPYDQTNILVNRGNMYSTIEDYEKSNTYYKEALKLAQNYGYPILTFKTLNNLGSLYKKQKQYAASEKLHKESLQYVKGNYNYESSVYNNLADLYLLKNEYKKALKHYQKALNTILQTQVDSYENLPEISSIELSPYKKVVLGYLIDKTNAWIAFYEHTSQESYLHHAEETMALADAIVDQLYVESREELSKLFWRKKGADLYTRAVSICYKLNRPEKAFYYMEKSKGLLLLENISNIKARQFGAIPEAIIDKDYEMTSQIKNLEYNLQYANRKKDSLKNYLFKLKIDYSHFIDSLETHYPVYHNLKKKLDILTLNTLKNNLNTDEVVIEYILGNEEGYVMYISKNDVILKKLTAINQLKEDLKKYKEKLSKPFVTKTDITEFKALSYKLKQAILPFETLNNKLQGKKINIVAEQLLQTIPFETLIIRYKEQEKYLIELSEVYYNYSMTLLSKLNTLEKENNGAMVAFSIQQFKNQYLPQLIEHASYAGIFDISYKNYSNTRATKANFLNAYNKNSMVSISTHGGIDNGQPWLGFYDEKLTLDELFFTKTQKEMVVLSACKTAVGNYIAGENTFNIARGFINSGAKSVISTLQNTNEQSGNAIILDFYKNLKKGQTKSEALQNAKLDYLHTHRNTSEASPYYWSSIILTGNNDALFETNNYLQYIKYLVFGLLALSIFYFLFKKKP